MDDCLEFESDPEMVAVARQFVRDRLTSWEVTDRVDGAVLVASELVTNAVLHARTAVTLRVEMAGPNVRIEVFDWNPRLPVAGPFPPDATSGRGLALIGALAGAWGMENRGDGKVVWAEIGPAEHERPDSCVDVSGAESAEEALRQIDRPGAAGDPTPG